MSTLRSEVERLATIVESDVLAITYQSMGQYRRDLLEVIRGALALPEVDVAEAVAAEREACAKACETQSARWYLSPRDVYVAHECAAAIRARAGHDEVTR